MLKLIVGLKGSGKTKTLISMANEAGDRSQGSVVCIEKGTKLIHEIKYQVRLIDTDEFGITDASGLYGFMCGIFASNSDITDLFVDGAYKICACDMATFTEFVQSIGKFSEKANINIVMTSSIALEDLPEALKAYI